MNLLLLFLFADFTATWVTDADLDQIAQRRDLDRLSLAQTRITDAGLERLRDLKGVRELDLYFAEFITDEGLVALAGWDKLERLNLRGTRLTSRAFETIAKLSSLKHLDLSYSQIDDSNVELLADLPQLESLSLGGTRIGVQALSALRLMPNLRHLDLSGMQRVDSGHWGLSLTPAVLEELGGIESLRTLRLNGAVLSDLGADRPGLKEEQRQSIEGLEKLARLKNLELLDLSRTPVSVAGLQSLKGLANLRELRLAQARNIDDSAIPLLSGWPLTALGLDGTAISPDGVEQLRRAKPQLRLLP